TEERPLPVADITFPSDEYEKSAGPRGQSTDDLGILKLDDNLPERSSSPGISFSDTITEVSADGNVSKHSADGYESDAEDKLKIGGDLKSSDAELDLGIEEVVI
ncbi:MAG: hypothetical protein EB075_08925, partial [Bacteroidetes bacterium]|nr:hypothetical protein [Bacteroidota bacterium]